jgi:methyl-accepting chemotaxis protein
MKQETDYISQFRKRVMYFFSVLGLIVTIVSLGGGFISLDQGGIINIRNLIVNIIIIVLFVALFILSWFDQVTLAGWVFCSVVTVTMSFSMFNQTGPDQYVGLESYISSVFIIIIVVAAAFISPLAAILFGIITTSAYVSISIYLISLLPGPVPALKGVNVAILALVMIGTTVLLFGFSNSLGRLLRSAREQTDELGWLNHALQQQRQIQAQTARQINELTASLSVIFRKQNNASQVQANMVNNLASTTQELDATARKIADNALSVATIAEKAQKSVEVGQQSAFQGVGAISAMRERVQAINDSMRTLDQQIERISEVTGIIGEIADETNLLALNATIEAAGAREYGRRFAAVADEVQRLSRRAASAVEQIQEMVLEINQASNVALLATEQGLREAQVGDKLVGGLTVANEDVGHLVSQTSTLANNIAEATRQQRGASAQIVEVMQKITQNSEGLVQAGEEINRMVATLEEASARLTQTEAKHSAPIRPGSRPNPTPPGPASREQPPLFSFEPEPNGKVELAAKAKTK